MAFIKKQSRTVDVFCFQEVYHSRTHDRPEGFHSRLYTEIARILPDFRGSFCTAQEGYTPNQVIDYSIFFGNALFVRRTHPIRKKGHFFIYRHRNALFDDLPGRKWKGKKAHDPSFALHRAKHFSPLTKRSLPEVLQYITVRQKNGSLLTIANVHGIWWPGTKRDTPERIEQSHRIISGLARLPGAKVICGDFNLLPSAESVRMIERAGYRNLIKEYGIKDTRGPVNRRKYINERPLQKYADFAFVSDDVRVKKFEVPQVSISDHLPLILTVDS
ncbi:endonuclease/exonuclease/phosphatase family protein [Candidatus Uhrbacteria bacterium]|nr:endonuclease/exonuclease/phosphatase family protein [Candidatus Uhrbacteria bacterium]